MFDYAMNKDGRQRRRKCEGTTKQRNEGKRKKKVKK